MTEKNIYQRLHEVMKEVSYVQKGDKQVNGQYRFVSHDAVTGKIRPALLTHGVLSIPQNMKHVKDGNMTIIEMDIRFVNIDKPEDFIDVPSVGYGIDSQDKGVGKAISYAVKYGLLKALSLETGDDPERDLIEHQPEPKFSPEAKSLQAEVITKIALSKDETEIQSVLDEYDISQLPDEMQGLINDQLDNRRQQITKGINPEVKSHKFAGVADQRSWVKRMLPVIKSIKSPETLTDWKIRNAAFIQGLADKGTEANPIAPRAFFLEELDKRAVELSPIG
jgi:hypothetical protein